VLSQEVEGKYYLSDRIKPTILSNGSGNFVSNSDIDQVVARPLTASMHKMHRACQDNYYSDLFINSHGANRPGINVPKSLSDLSKYGPEAATIYEVIAKNWLAMLAEDYEYEHQTGHVTDHPEFVGTANIPLKPGYKAVYDADSESKDKKEDDTEKDGGEGKPLGKKAKAFVHEGANPKPQRPTQNWLIGKNGQLTKYNVGTGATRTSTLAEITDGSGQKKKVQLMTEKRGVLDLTEIGWVSYKLLEGCMIASPKVTEQLFTQMEEVGQFRLDPEKVINEITQIMVHDMAKMRNNAANLKKGDIMSYGEKEKVTGL
jgi:DNA topoisomerase-3